MAGVLAFAPTVAYAAPTAESQGIEQSPSAGGAPGANAPAAKADDRSDPAAEKRRDLNQQAVEKVIKGEAPSQDRNGSKAVKVAPGQWAQYGLQDSDEILSILDTGLKTGPYNFGWSLSAPHMVEHFRYQDGLSITYWNTAQRNNNTRQHPRAGLALPVDAHPKALTWSDGAIARNRIQSFDATFGKAATDPLTLHRELGTGMTTLNVATQPGVAVFNDTNPGQYYDAANPQGSVPVAGTGTSIEVIQSN